MGWQETPLIPLFGLGSGLFIDCRERGRWDADGSAVHRLSHHGRDLTGRGTTDAVVVGHGNVAVDICRMLLSPRDALASTDITSESLDVLAASTVRRTSGGGGGSGGVCVCVCVLVSGCQCRAGP